MLAASLETIDPKQAWQPADLKTWDLRRAAHLYRRAAFGFPPANPASSETSWDALQARVKLGAEACLEELLPEAAPESKSATPFDRLLDSLGERIARGGDGEDSVRKLQGWWLYRMLYTPRPLVERMTLLWHNHFATSVEKVRRLSLMLQQNQLLRQQALGKFPALLVAMGRNPAMIVWLDSGKNVKGRPNENYAREVMELFSLGVGNYTERDIREAARALTGFSTDGDKFVFQTALHDEGSKTIFGETGNFGGDDVARLVLQQPAAGQFLARKLFREFVSDLEPPAELLEPLARQLRETDYDMRAAVRTVLSSQLFYSDAAYRARIKSPVEYVVGLLRAFDRRVRWEEMAGAMDGLGQKLFAPPNVKGWDGGATWLNSATLIRRHNLAWDLVLGRQFVGDNAVGLLAGLKADAKPQQQVQRALEIFLQGDVAPPVRQGLVEFLREDSKASPQRIQEMVHTVLMLPEYQLA